MKNRIALIAAMAALLASASCSKDDDAGPIGGKGGNATLRVNTFHHQRRIDSCMVYIKYNSQDAPANGRYDDSARIVKAPADTVATFPGLKAGKYYLFGKGWDTGGPYAVQGGLPYTVTEEKVVEFDLPVTEDH